MTKTTIPIVFVCVILSIASSSEANTITFNGTTSGAATNLTGPYSEAGYTLTPLPANNIFFYDSTNSGYPGVAQFDDDSLGFGSDAFVNFSVSKDGGGLFDLVSVKTANLYGDPFADGNFVFTGHLAGGGTVTATVAALTLIQTFTFSGFTSLTSITVDTTDGFAPVMDDLVLVESVQAVPDAGSTMTMVLLAAGAIGTAVSRYRS